jgi:cytochrome c oxidase subunit 4
MSDHPSAAQVLRAYLGVAAALAVLTALTVFVAYMDLGVLNTPVALVIAGTKATLVIVYFMHVRWAPRFIGFVAVAGFAWLAILVLITLSDFLTRGWLRVLVPA